jgi:hypothetical protein
MHNVLGIVPFVFSFSIVRADVLTARRPISGDGTDGAAWAGDSGLSAID